MSIDRRKFLSQTAALGGIVLSPFEDLISEKPAFRIPPNFTTKIMATNWGFSGSWDAFCDKAKQSGYDGIELWWQNDPQQQKEVFAALKKHQLSIGFLTAGSDRNPATHLEQFKKMINAAVHQQEQRPLYINCHSGRDHFSFEQNKLFIEHGISLAKETGIFICHETHRSRILFAAHIARQYIEKFPNLRLTFDVSHWCNVHETLLEDQDETVQLALSRVDHIHARIGHQEGPQVNDPRAPEWANALKRHLEWWDKIVQLKIKSGANSITILTEFGPPDYMPTMPYTRQPLGDQWNINVYMMQLLRKRYQQS
jgi:sugar phosphate isomerase/epimerase